METHAILERERAISEPPQAEVGVVMIRHYRHGVMGGRRFAERLSASRHGRCACCRCGVSEPHAELVPRPAMARTRRATAKSSSSTRATAIRGAQRRYLRFEELLEAT